MVRPGRHPAASTWSPERPGREPVSLRTQQRAWAGELHPLRFPLRTRRLYSGEVRAHRPTGQCSTLEQTIRGTYAHENGSGRHPTGAPADAP
jgi:hypothetical protein